MRAEATDGRGMRNEPTGDASDRRGWGKWRWPEATSRRGRRRSTQEAPAGEVNGRMQQGKRRRRRTQEGAAGDVRGGGWEEWIIWWGQGGKYLVDGRS